MLKGLVLRRLLALKQFSHSCALCPKKGLFLFPASVLRSHCESVYRSLSSARMGSLWRLKGEEARGSREGLQAASQVRHLGRERKDTGSKERMREDGRKMKESYSGGL